MKTGVFKGISCSVAAFALAAVGAGGAYAETGSEDINAKIEAGDSQIALDDDILGNVVIPTGKSVTIDLNGHKITGTSGSTITNNGTLTIAGNGEVVSVAAYAVDNHGTLTINGGSYSTTVNVDYNKSKKGALVGSAPSLIRNGWDGPTTDDLAYMTINGGSFTGGLNNVKNDEHGVLTVNGGDFTQYDGQNIIINGGKSLTINGGDYRMTTTGSTASYYFAVQNQRFGADHEKSFTVNGANIQGRVAFDQTKYSGDFTAETASTYAVNIKNATIASLVNLGGSSYPLKCSSFTIEGSTLGMSGYSALCDATIKNSTFTSSLSLTSEGQTVTVKDVDATYLKIIRTKSTIENFTATGTTASSIAGTTNSDTSVVLKGGSYKNCSFHQNSVVTLADGVKIDGNVTVTTNPTTLNMEDATITGNINVNWKNGATLNITGGTLQGSIVTAEAALAAEGDNYTLSGGTYGVEPDTKYVAEGKAAYKAGGDGPWVIEDQTTVNTDPIYLGVGQTTKLNLTEIAQKYATWSVVSADDLTDDTDELAVTDPLATVATIDEDGNITAIAAGRANVQVILHDEGDEGRMFLIPVYVYSISDADSEGTSDAVVKVEASVKADDLTTDEEEKIGEVLTAEGGEVIEYYDIDASLYVSGTDTGADIPELGSLATIRLTIPEAFRTPADGYLRTFYMIRYHGGVAERLNTVVSRDGKSLTFQSDKFSTYALAYVDTAVVEDETDGDGATSGDTETDGTGTETDSTDAEAAAETETTVIETVTSGEEATLTSTETTDTDEATATVNPKTLDNVMNYFAMAGGAAVVMLGAIVYLMRREA